MGFTKVWNITDDTNPDVAPQNLMVLGRNLKPGQAVKVDEAHLKTAHKVHKDKDRGLLHIGMKPPVSYSKVKKPPRATVDAPRSHGPIKEVEAEKAVVELKDNVVVEEQAEVTAKAVEEVATVEEAAPEETKEEEFDKKSKKKRYGR